MTDVVLSNDDITILGPPSTIELSVDIGPQGDRGSQIFVGVGGSFDFLSGIKPRAPKFLQTIGLEWLFRLFNEPSRFSRIWKAVVTFSYLIFKKVK